MSNYFRTVLVLFGLLVINVRTGLTEDTVDDPVFDEEEPLRCYFCHGMGPTNPCEMYQPYVDAWEAKDDEHEGPVTLKTCTAPFDVSCMIETFINNNGEVAHIRDCSDDKTFDFTENSNNISSYSRLLSLHDNNETACTYDGQNTVCLSKCGHSENLTNFCNGPQFDSSEVTTFSKLLYFTIMFCYIALYP